MNYNAIENVLEGRVEAAQPRLQHVSREQACKEYRPGIARADGLFCPLVKILKFLEEVKVNPNVFT